MKKQTKMIMNGLMSAVAVLSAAGPVRAQSVQRPPQYVALAFDGSYTLKTWQYLRDYSKNYEATNGKPAKFTFFINPIYLLQQNGKNRFDYQAPRRAAGKSNIGFGDDQKDIALRLQQMNAAAREGHEIASHAVGHFDGSGWTYNEWKSELTQFDWILDNVFALNNLDENKYGGGLIFREVYPNFDESKKIVGFRAPQLGVSEGLYQVFNEVGYKYDTSKIAKNMNYWPEKTAGGWWNFPLARIPVPGTAKIYPTMDYNFCANDTLELLKSYPELASYAGVDSITGKKVRNGDGRVNPDCMKVLPPDLKSFIKERMKKAYMNYFYNNYYGNRAPISIGHHFSAWMGGAYFEAFMEVTEQICKKSEVKCVTNKELMQIMNGREMRANVDAYRNGDFEKLPRAKATLFDRPLELAARLKPEGAKLKLELDGADAKQAGLVSKLYVNNREIEGTELDLEKLRSSFAKGSSVRISGSVLNRQGLEVQSVTHDLTGLATAAEKLSELSLEESNVGDSDAAHADEAGDDHSH